MHGRDHVTEIKPKQRDHHLKFAGFHNQSPVLTMIHAMDLKSRDCFPWPNTALTLTCPDLNSNLVRRANPNTKRYIMTASLTIQYKNNGYNEVLPAKFLHNVATNGSKPNGIYQNGAFF